MAERPVAEKLPKSGYLPSLDGWRCFAILGVMWAHDARRVIHGHHTDFWQGLGGYGVVLFFALSGVLISWRIRQDEQKQGRFSLRNFYIRRFFRIQPPQWAYLSVVAVLMLSGALPTARWKYWWGALLMFENFLWHNLHTDIVVPASYLVGHFWTLAVEEHFYLFISLFFFFVRRSRAVTLGCLLTLILVVQQLAISRQHFSVDVSNRRTYWAIQYLLFPAFIVLVLEHAPTLAWVRRYWKPWVAFLTTVVLMYAQSFYYGYRRPHLRDLVLYGTGVLLYGFTGWIVATMLHPASWTTRFLELAPLRFIGRLSYSLYLWHLLFFGGGAPSRCTWSLLTALNTPPFHYVCSFLLALASYYFVEKPMIRLGHRLAPPATPGHRDLSQKTPFMSLA